MSKGPWRYPGFGEAGVPFPSPRRVECAVGLNERRRSDPIALPGPRLNLRLNPESECANGNVSTVSYGDNRCLRRVALQIYDQANRLLASAPMVEVLPRSGIYHWVSSDTILSLRVPKGVYLVRITAT